MNKEVVLSQYKHNVKALLDKSVTGAVTVFWNELFDTLYVQINQGFTHFVHMDRQALIKANYSPSGKQFVDEVLCYYSLYLTKIFFIQKEMR